MFNVSKYIPRLNACLRDHRESRIKNRQQGALMSSHQGSTDAMCRLGECDALGFCWLCLQILSRCQCSDLSAG